MLKGDFSKFFYTLLHAVCFEKARKALAFLSDEELIDFVEWLLWIVIDSTPDPGIPIGNQSSQLLALLYLDDFDHWLRDDLGLVYGRYMDDFYIISSDKLLLREILKRIEEYIKPLGLRLNGKTQIFPLKNGIDFLGFHTYLTSTGKVVRKMEPANGNSDRRNYGNNRYIYSNLRQWLNSDAAAGRWYTAQHSADQAPDSSHVWSGYNAYNTIAGFLNGFTANERAALLATTITVGKSSTDGGGTETCVDKVFPLSCTEVNLSGDHVCGSKLAIFSDNSSRIATVSASAAANSNYDVDANQAWYYWLRDAYAGSALDARLVRFDGALYGSDAYDGYLGLRPACNLSSDLLVSDTTDSDGCYTIVYNQPPTAPGTITVPSEVIGGENLSISWGQSTDPDGNLAGYKLERKVDDGTWAQIYSGSSRSYTDSITYGWTSVQYRVKAYDTAGAESAYTTSAVRTVTNNRPPVISGSDTDLGSFTTTPPSYEYTVTDADGHQVTVVEKLDTTTLRTYTATLGDTNELEITADQWLKLLNGDHTLTITATDAKNESTVRTLSFDKAMHSVEFEQTVAMAADDMPTKALVNIQGSFPTGSTLQVWICNNGNDAEPTWEDITTKALTSQKHFFTNQTKTAASWGVKIKVKLLRGSAEGDCYIQSVGGNFA